MARSRFPAYPQDLPEGLQIFLEAVRKELSKLGVSGGASIQVQKSSVAISTAANILNFLGTDFDLTQSPVGKVNINANANLARLNAAGQIFSGGSVQVNPGPFVAGVDPGGTALVRAGGQARFYTNTTYPGGEWAAPVISIIDTAGTGWLSNNFLALSLNGAAGQITVGRSRGTLASPSPMLVGDVLGALWGAGQYDTTVGHFFQSAGFRIFAAENWSATTLGSYITAVMTPPGSATSSNYFRWDYNAFYPLVAGGATLGLTSLPFSKLTLGPSALVSDLATLRIRADHATLDHIFLEDSNGSPLAGWRFGIGSGDGTDGFNFFNNTATALRLSLRADGALRLQDSIWHRSFANSRLFYSNANITYFGLVSSGGGYIWRKDTDTTDLMKLDNDSGNIQFAGASLNIIGASGVGSAPNRIRFNSGSPVAIEAVSADASAYVPFRASTLYATSDVRAKGALYGLEDGAGTALALQLGNDLQFYDIDLADTIQMRGLSHATQAYWNFGSGSGLRIGFGGTNGLYSTTGFHWFTSGALVVGTDPNDGSLMRIGGNLTVQAAGSPVIIARGTGTSAYEGGQLQLVAAGVTTAAQQATWLIHNQNNLNTAQANFQIQQRQNDGTYVGTIGSYDYPTAAWSFYNGVNIPNGPLLVSGNTGFQTGAPYGTVEIVTYDTTHSLSFFTSSYDAAKQWGTRIFKNDIGGGIPLQIDFQNASTWRTVARFDDGQSSGHEAFTAYYDVKFDVLGIFDHTGTRFGTGTGPVADDVMSWHGGAQKWRPRFLQTQFTNGVVFAQNNTDGTFANFAFSVTYANTTPAVPSVPVVTPIYGGFIIDMGALPPSGHSYVVDYSINGGAFTTNRIIFTSQKMVHTVLSNNGAQAFLATDNFSYKAKGRGKADGTNDSAYSAASANANYVTTTEVNAFGLVLASQVTAVYLSAITANVGSITAGQLLSGDGKSILQLDSTFSVPGTVTQGIFFASANPVGAGVTGMYIDFTATTTNPLFHHSKFDLLADGSAILKGVVRDVNSKFVIDVGQTTARLITIIDEQVTPRTRVKIGEVNTGTSDWGMQVFDNAGATIVDMTAANLLIQDSAVKFKADFTAALLTVTDNQGSPKTRAKLGKVNTGTTDYGLQVFDTAGSTIVDMTASNLLIQDAAVKLKADFTGALITVTDNQGSAKIRAKLGKIGAGTTDYGLQVFDNAGTVIVDMQQSNLLIQDALVKFKADFTNALLTVTDSQGSPKTRVKVGKLAGGTTDYGIQVYDTAGSTIMDMSASNLLIQDAAGKYKEDFTNAILTVTDSQSTGTKREILNESMLSQSGLTAYAPANIADFNTASEGWHTDSAVPGAYLMVDFGSGVTRDIVKVRVFVEASGGSKAIWDIEYSDNNSSWTAASTGFAPTFAGWNSVAFTSAGAHRYWRLKLTNTPGGGNWNNELELYSQNAPAIRLRSGKVGSDVAAYGLQMFEQTGQTIFDFTGTKRVIAVPVQDAGVTAVDKTLDFSTGQSQMLQLQASSIRLKFTGVVDGGRYRLWLQQDTTGSRLVPAFDDIVMWPGDAAPTLATVPGQFDVIEFEHRANPTPRFSALILGTQISLPTPRVQSVTATSVGVASQTHNISMPASVVSGDLLVMLFVNAGTSALTVPTGWTDLTNAGSDPTTFKFRVYTKISDGTEGGTTVNVASATASLAAGQVYRITQWYGKLSAVDGTVAGSATNANPDPPSFTFATTDRYLVLAIEASVNQPTVNSYPASYTNGTYTASTGAGGVQLGSARRSIFAASENPGTFTLSVGTNLEIAATVAIRPPA